MDADSFERNDHISGETHTMCGDFAKDAALTAKER
jgi:hypothetical protein